MEERVQFSNSRSLKLVGDLSVVDANRAVILSHGFMSDRDGRGRIPALAAALNEAGISTLRYDFAGCGESDDDILTPDGLRDDLHSAIRFMQQKGFSSIGLYGHSLGGTISIWSFLPEIEALATTGAATGPCTYRFEDFFTPEMLDELKRTGILPAPGRSQHRPMIRASQALMHAFNHFSADELLNHLTVPILLVHGDGDDEERMLSEIAKKSMPRLPKGSEVKIHAGAPHDMMAIWPEVIAELVSWFRSHLS